MTDENQDEATSSDVHAVIDVMRELGTDPVRGALVQQHAALLEKMNDPRLKAKLADLAQTLDASASTVQGTELETVRQAAHTVRATQLMLPLFEAAYALPNAFLRSALFPVLDTKQPRPFIKGQKLYAVGEWWCKFTGEQFDQGDLDVLAGILEVGAPINIGSAFSFSSYSLLSLLGRPTGGEQYAALHEAIIRLKGGVVEIGRGKRGRIFLGNFIEGPAEASEAEASGARTYKINLNPNLGVLFGFDMWSQVHRRQRQALGKNGTAKALHGFYSSHAAPGAHRYETLAGIVGLQNKQKSGVKRRLIKAHDALTAPACGFLTGYEAGPETIVVQKSHTPSQLRHLEARQPRKRGRPRKTLG